MPPFVGGADLRRVNAKGGSTDRVRDRLDGRATIAPDSASSLRLRKVRRPASKPRPTGIWLASQFPERPPHWDYWKSNSSTGGSGYTLEMGLAGFHLSRL
jgi:hypothetical protein